MSNNRHLMLQIGIVKVCPHVRSNAIDRRTTHRQMTYERISRWHTSQLLDEILANQQVVCQQIKQVVYQQIAQIVVKKFTCYRQDDTVLNRLIQSVDFFIYICIYNYNTNTAVRMAQMVKRMYSRPFNTPQIDARDEHKYMVGSIVATNTIYCFTFTHNNA